ncbi:M4 family metallopeptidase [Herbivorax sp. ANBcel31]|uniref:M4 family metallopeptidase n=1 Tax=Herbivorax sp. ANBcel31 TaxID=3069754 RepID=UPI0027B5AF23|nr:M4 family metallopeptidase [Herbivorax sp. ANBcel31]MDQ2085699.1 M4 family metallopeptidase [Herbivorax sp. ANBcel31]
MKGLAKVLCIILLVGIIASGTIVSYGDVEESKEFTPEIALMNKTNDDVTFISGRLTERSEELPEEIVRSVYAKSFEEREVKVDELEFEITEQITNSMGRTVVKTVQVQGGVPVYGSEKNFHVNNEGVVEVVSGKSIGNIGELSKKSTPLRISEEEIINLIERDLGYRIEIFNMSSPKLILYPVDDIYQYVYKVTTSILEPEPNSFTYYICGENLDVINVERVGADSQNSVCGTGVGEFGLIEDLKMVEENEIFYLINPDENFETGEAVNFQVFNNTENHFEADPDLPISRLTHGVDAHYNLTKIIEFFNDHFNRNSYDDEGGLIRCRIMFGPHNARAEPYGNWGDHSEVWFFNRKPLDEEGNEITEGKSTAAALDIVAHEFTHLILYHEGLDYNDGQENMALHEGLADTFGVISEYALEDYLLSEGEFDWYIGEDTGKVMRNAAYPEITQYSDVPNMDPFIPHNAGGVITKAAYLIAEGGTHNEKEIEAIGYSKLAGIFYKAMTDGYVVPQSSLKDFAGYAVTVVNLLKNEQYSHSSIKGEDSIYYCYDDVNTVIDAFTSVELLLGAPGNFEMTDVEELAVDFTWDAISEANYGIYRKETDSEEQPEKIAQTTETEITVETLPGIHDFYIALVDEDGNRISGFSNAVTVEAYLNEPENLRISKEIGLITKVKWDYNEASCVRYGIYAKPSWSEDEPEKIAETSIKMFFTISLWGSYDYYVAVVDENGERISDYSNKVTVKSSIFCLN